MARLLCLSSELSGPLFSTTELARRLACAGHRLTVASAPEARRVVAAQGLDFVPLAASHIRDFLFRDRRKNVFQRWGQVAARRRRAVESLGLDDLPELIRATDPDLLLIDGEKHEHILRAAASGRPIALLNSFASIWRCPGLPPTHRLARPGVGWKGSRLGMWLLWQELRLRKLRTACRHFLDRAGCDRLSLLRHLAAESGFDYRRETDFGQWLMPFTYRRIPVLSLHAREFEFPHEPPPHVTYVGPLRLENRADPELPTGEREKLTALFRRRDHGERKLIFAGFGSFFTADRGFLRRLFAAVAEREGWELVLSLGGQDPGALGPLPSNVSTFRWLPQLEVLEHTDVAVIHGGINTVDECVLAGVPMLVYCGFETDMAGNTSRIVFHGLGLAGHRGRDQPDTIRSHIDRLLQDPAYGERVRRMGGRFAANREEQVAERTVQRLLASSRGKP